MKRGNPNMRKGAPSINPNGRNGKAVRTDGMVNPFSGHGTSDDARSYTRHRTRPVSEIEAIDLRRGNWLAKRIVELRPADCFRRGYDLKLEDKDIAEQVMTRLEELCVNEKLVAAAQMENTVGGAALFPVLEGAVGELHEPLDLDDEPRILGIRAIHLFESRELQPETWYDDITSPKFRRPKTYRVYALSGGGVTHRTPGVIHESRLAVFPGVQVSAEPQPGQPWGWGDSKLTPVLDVIQDFGLAWGSAATILRNFSERVQAVSGLMKILATKGGAEAVRENLKVLDLVRSTLRTRIVDAEANVSEQSKSVSGLSDMLVQFAQLVSAAAEEPMTRLFGMSPGGMNATGEYDQQMGHEQIATDQRIKYTAPVEWFARLVMLSAEGPTNGNEPDVWSVKWKPLRHPDEKEIADTRKVVAETDKVYFEMGMPAEGILRDRFGGDGYSMETRFDETDFAKQKKADEESAAAVQAAMQELDKGAPAGGQGAPDAKPTDEEPRE